MIDENNHERSWEPRSKKPQMTGNEKLYSDIINHSKFNTLMYSRYVHSNWKKQGFSFHIYYSVISFYKRQILPSVFHPKADFFPVLVWGKEIIIRGRLQWEMKGRREKWQIRGGGRWGGRCTVRKFIWWRFGCALWRNCWPFPAIWRNFSSNKALR